MGDNWRRAIVRVWYGKPTENGVYRGTAFFVAPGYLLTCKHVVEDLPYEKIFLQSDTGAWYEGGLRKIQKYVVHHSHDVALLPLVKSVPDAYCIPLASAQEADLQQKDDVQLAGYTTPLSSLETPELRISAYVGDYDLEIAHTAIGKGMSGGPVLRDGQLVGITRAKDDIHTYIVRVNSFRDFLPDLQSTSSYTHLQCIPPTQLMPLKELLTGVTLSEEVIIATFHKIAPQLSERLSTDANNLLFDALDLMGDSPHKGPDQAPILEFLITLPLPQSPTLINWQQEVARAFSIDMQKIAEKATKNISTLSKKSPILLAKIEPEQLISENLFRVRAWLYQDDKPSPISQEDRTYSVLELESILPYLLGQARKKLPANEAKELLVEIIVPLSLWHWNLSRISAPIGPLKQPLGKLYAIVLRSWERIYHQDYDSIRYQWEDKWRICPCGKHFITSTEIHFEQTLSTDYLSLYDKLQHQHFVFTTLFPVTSMSENLPALFGTMLAAGLPFALWPLCSPIDRDAMTQVIHELVCNEDFNNWPKILHTKRKTDENIWQDLQLLWDNPERLPPDVAYSLISPE